MYQEKYPGISLEEMKKICSSEFDMLKEVMSEGNLEEVRLQYLFVAKTSPAKVIKHLRGIYQRKKKGTIREKDFNKYNDMLTKYILDNPKKFEKYEDKIRKIVS